MNTVKPCGRFSSIQVGEFGRAFGVVSDDFLEPLFGRVRAGAFEDAADGAGDFGALIQAGHISLGVLLEVELAALPGDGAKDGLARGRHAGMIVADDEGDAAQTALDEALEEGAPMHFGFAQGDAHAEDGRVAFGRDAQGDEDGTVAQLAVVADFFVAGIEHQIGTGGQRPVAPLLEFGVEGLAHWLTWVELTAVPQSSSTMAETLRVETPWTYISAMASLRACSERSPFSKALG